MDRAKLGIPFGLLFEEPAPEPRDLITPTYDESSDLSCVETSEGKRVPYVELSRSVMTETVTRVVNEVTDEDESLSMQCVETQTETKVIVETTDRDPGIDVARWLGIAGTQTITEVRAESTDTDLEDDSC